MQWRSPPFLLALAVFHPDSEPPQRSQEPLLVCICTALYIERTNYIHALGIFLMIYGSYLLVCRPRFVPWQHPAFDVFTGLLGGVTGGAVGFPSAPVTIWCGTKGWDKGRQRAALQPFILILQVLALVSIGLYRPGAELRLNLDLSDIIPIFSSLLGICIGLSLYNRLTDQHFAVAVNGLLLIAGISYVL